MSLTALKRLSVLACISGLALIAIFFLTALTGAPNPEWLPLTISGIAGFELFMVLNALKERRAGGGRNG